MIKRRSKEYLQTEKVPFNSTIPLFEITDFLKIFLSLSPSPKEGHVKLITSVPQNVALFGKRI